MTTATDTRSMLDTLYAGVSRGYAVLWAKSGSECFDATDPTALDKMSERALARSREEDCYFDVCLMGRPVGSGQRGKVADVICVPGFWADVDIKPDDARKPSTLKEAADFLKSLPLKPSLVLRSGNGLHVYWLFDEPLEISGADDRAVVAEMAAGWLRFINERAREHGWVFDSVFDLARVLRLPGTLNHKSNPPTSVALIHRSELRYPIAAFSEHVIAAPASKAATRANASTALTDAEIVQIADRASNGAKFRALYFNGDVSAYGDDESRADEALLCLLAFYTRDPGQLERLFSGSALGRRGKWIDRADYRERSIERALNFVGESYAGSPAQTVLRAGGRAFDHAHRNGSNGKHDGAESQDITENITDPNALLLTDFASYLPERKYIYLPTGKVWEPAGVNRAFPPIGVGKDKIQQSTFVDEQCPVHDLSWAPGKPQIIEGVFLDQGGWIEKAGARVYNGYRPPRTMDGNPAKAERWIEHIGFVYPDAVDHLVSWLAHRVQRPGEKVNHALVLGGTQGIGKDTIFEPVRHAVGPWNFGDVSPIELLGRFNAFLKNVILRVSELRDLGDRDRYGFYEHTKTLIAAPPDTLHVDEKNIRAYRIPNLVGMIFTTNHRTDGLFLPADDRRHYVAWSDLTPNDFPDGYWTDLYHWFENDGNGGSGIAHVAAYLASYDLSNFSPKTPPVKTAAFWDVVAAGSAPEDAEIATAVGKLNDPAALTIDDLAEASTDMEFRTWLRDRKNSRQIPHRLESAGYVATRNPDIESGFWMIKGRRQVIYAKRTITISERIRAARERTGRMW